MLVACATDRRFVELTAVMLRSFAANAYLPDAQAIVFEEGLREKDRGVIRESAAPHEVRFVDLSNAESYIGKLPVQRNWPAANYIRLVAPELIPDRGRLLYLDCDIIINRSLADLVDLDMGGAAVGAVPGLNMDWQRTVNRRLGRPEEWPVFNAGVLLVDMDQWRKQRIAERILSWAAANQNKIKGLSQDPITAALANDWMRLPQSYNAQGKNIKTVDGFADAHIIHFTGTTKPDHAGCNHAATPLYLEHRRSTPYGDRPLISRARRRLYRLADNMKFAVRKILKP